MKVYHGSFIEIVETDESTELYKKDWTEIYELLKQELNG